MLTLNRRSCLQTLIGGSSGLAMHRAWAETAPARPYKVYGVELPPLIMATPQGATGIVSEIVQQAFRLAGAPLEIEVVPWARGYAELKAGQATGLIPTIRSEEREALFDFSKEPVFRAEMALFASASKPPAWSGKLSEVAGLSFVHLRGALVAPEFDSAVREGRIRSYQANSFGAAIRMLAAGRVDLAAMPKLAGLQIAAAEGLSAQVLPLEPPLHVQDFYLAFARKPELADLRQRIDEALKAMSKDGSSRAILEAYRLRKWVPAPKPA